MLVCGGIQPVFSLNLEKSPDCQTLTRFPDSIMKFNVRIEHRSRIITDYREILFKSVWDDFVIAVEHPDVGHFGIINRRPDALVQGLVQTRSLL